MTALLEWKEKIAAFYGKYQKAISAAVRFTLAFAVFLSILLQISTQEMWQQLITALVPALFCLFLPYGTISIFAVGEAVILAWFLDAGVGIAMLLIALASVLLYFVFRPEYGCLAGVSVFLCLTGIPGALPVAAGLLCGPTALIPMVLGVLYYDCISVIQTNFSALSSFSTAMDETEKISYFLERSAANSRAMVVGIAYAAAFLTTWVIRRRPFSRSAGIATASGMIVYILVVLAASVFFSASVSTAGMVAGCSIGTVAAVLIILMNFTMDGSLTETLEYEDENYHYYVKAVPKLKVARKSVQVRRFTDGGEEPLEADDFPDPEKDEAAGDAGISPAAGQEVPVQEQMTAGREKGGNGGYH